MTTETTESRPATDAHEPASGGRPGWLVPLLVVGAVVLGVGLWLTQPWLLFVDVVADEALPITVDAADAAAVDDGAGSTSDGPAADDDTEEVEDRMGTVAGEPDGAVQPGVGDAATTAADPAPDDGEPAAPAADGSADTPDATTGPVVLRTGSFISRDHVTSGAVSIVRLEDGSHVLTIEGLATDNGPDLFVYLDDTAADGPEGDFDDGTSLGRLRANQGDLVYEIPAGVDLDAVVSVGIWCDRFSSLFGAADLLPVG